MSQHDAVVEEVVAAEQPVKESYREFVKAQMQTIDREAFPKGTERMRQVALAWREKHGASQAGVQKAKKKSAGVSLREEHVPTLNSIREVHTLLSGPVSDEAGGNTARRSRTHFVIPRTRKQQKALNYSIKGFQNAVKAGQVLSLEQAFTSGMNSVLELARKR